MNCGSIDLAIRDYGGRGNPVVLLHGGTRNLGDWATIAPDLAPFHRVVALDFRSHGAATPCGAWWSVADAVADVQAVVAALDLDTPWLVGHSIGGIIATQYAAEQGACRGVVNIDGVGVSLPPVLPGPEPVGTRTQLQAMITQMAEALAPAAAPLPSFQQRRCSSTWIRSARRPCSVARIERSSAQPLSVLGFSARTVTMRRIRHRWQSRHCRRPCSTLISLH